MRNIFGVLGVCVIAAVIFVGCQENKLIGTWESVDVGIEVTFTKNEYATYMFGQKLSAAYTVKNSTIITEMYGAKQEIPFSINGDILTFNGQRFKRVN
jgi:hypothetical protein